MTALEMVSRPDFVPRVTPQLSPVRPQAYPSQKEAQYYGLGAALRAVLARGGAVKGP